jgi:uncharacterized membrane-anchored protein YjiN (DUF445 family)
MQWRATSLLIGAAAVFVVARVLEGEHGWAGYVRATAEAAMVGGLADWFAVTALFRHPLRLPIPHTAIIPRRKDQLGASLGSFVEQNFLSDDVISDKLRSTSIARRAARWANEPANAGALARHLGAALDGALDVMRDDDVQELVEHAALARLRTIRAAPLAGQVLEAVTADRRHQELVDVSLRGLRRFLEENRSSFRTTFARESPWWVPEAIDERIFEKIFNGLQALLDDVSARPDHELRAYLDQRLEALAVKLRTSPELAARGEALKEEFLAHPAVRRLTGTLWADLKQSLQQQTADPDSELHRRIDATVLQLSRTVLDDPALAEKIDRWVESVVHYVVRSYRHEITDLITTTVGKWDPHDASRRIELQVGRDLQFIRINGTIVGGLAGLVIHCAGRFLG